MAGLEGALQNGMRQGSGVVVGAPAKITLYLHVTGRRDDGYHLLESLVAFTEAGDCLHVAPGEALEITLGGPFGTELAELAPEDNLVLRAAGALARRAGVEPNAAIHLQKNLPVAAGIGGGSSDAAAALKAFVALLHLDISEDALKGLALTLGADVPVCLEGRPAWMSGVGEVIEPVAGGLPRLPLLLVNPGLPVSTPAVFKHYAQTRAGRSYDALLGSLPALKSPGALIDFLGQTHNALTESAIAVAPSIAGVLDRLNRLDGVCITRLCGSGGTCYALFEDMDACHDAALALQGEHPDWWIEATVLRPA